MAYKITKTEIKKMDTVELVGRFEECIAELIKEANFSKGETKTTLASFACLKAEVISRIEN